MKHLTQSKDLAYWEKLFGINVWLTLPVYRQISINFIHVYIYLIFTFLTPHMMLAFGHVSLYTKMNICAVKPWTHIPRLTWAHSAKL